MKNYSFKKSFLLGLCTFLWSSSSPSSIQSNIHPIDMIEKPVECLSYILQKREIFFNKCAAIYKKSLIQDPSQASSFLAQHHSSLLNKCTQEEALLFLSEDTLHSTSLLDRSKNPKEREAFENFIVKKLEEIHTEKNCVHYASFGCQETFTDLLILTKFLSKYPTATLTISFIETPIIFRRDAAFVGENKNNIEVNRLESDHALSQIYLEYINKSPEELITHTCSLGEDKYIKENICNLIQISSEEFEDHLNKLKNIESRSILSFEAILYKHKYTYLLWWLQKHFPHARISMQLHENADTITAQAHPCPDLIAAVNLINDNLSILSFQDSEYTSLCTKCSILNPSCLNFCLAAQVTNPDFTSPLNALLKKPVSVFSIALKAHSLQAYRLWKEHNSKEYIDLEIKVFFSELT